MFEDNIIYVDFNTTEWSRFPITEEQEDDYNMQFGSYIDSIVND